MTNSHFPHFPLRAARVHEVCGPGADLFAFALAAQLQARVLWVREGWRVDGLNPTGFAPLFDPSKLLVAQAKDQTEILAVGEEALRSGALDLVVLEIAKPLDLTAGRRLQLAAKEGKTIGLAQIPEGMGSNAAETRWHCAPVFDASDSTRQRWQIIKNKTGTLGSWDVRWDAATHRVIVLSPVGERPGSAGTPG